MVVRNRRFDRGTRTYNGYFVVDRKRGPPLCINLRLVALLSPVFVLLTVKDARRLAGCRLSRLIDFFAVMQDGVCVCVRCLKKTGMDGGDWSGTTQTGRQENDKVPSLRRLSFAVRGEPLAVLADCWLTAG